MKRRWMALPFALALASCSPASEPKTFTVTHQEVEGITFSGEDQIQEGETYSFSLALKEGYETGESFQVICNDAELEGQNLSYTVDHVSSDLDIRISGVEKITYDVHFLSSEGIHFTGESHVSYGSSYSFHVESEEKYVFDSLSVKENGTQKEFVSVGDHAYRIEDVKGELSIGVDNKRIKTFSVVKDFESSHYVFHGADEVEYGSSYSFQLDLAPGFSKGANYFFLVNDLEPKKNEEGYYVIEKVTNGVRIEAFGEEEAKINVGFECDIPGALKNKDEQIRYSLDTYRFTLDFEDRYSQSKDKVRVYASIDGVETLLSKNESDEYSLANPHKDFKIIVKGASVNVYDVQFYFGDEVVYTKQMEDGASLEASAYQEAEAKFNEKANPSGHRFEYWEEESNGPIHSNLKIHGFSALGISSLDELTSDGSFYLKNDIEITSIKNMPSFSGYLNGDGHLISSSPTTLLRDSSENAAVLFSSFSGTLKNLKLDFTLGFYSLGLSGIAGSMEGGTIENVDAKITYSGLMFASCGSLVGKMNAGTLRNCNIDFASYRFDSQDDDAYSIGAILGQYNGGEVRDIHVYIPGGLASSKVKMAVSGDESKWDSCSISSKEEKRKDSAIGGTLTETTYQGLSVYSKSIRNGMGGAIFDTLDLSSYSHLSFFLKIGDCSQTGDTIGINGSNSLSIVTSTSSREVWHYVDIQNLKNGSFKVRAYPLCDFANCNAYSVYLPTYGEFEATDLAAMGRFYSWIEASTATAYATAVYGTLLGE